MCKDIEIEKFENGEFFGSRVDFLLRIIRKGEIKRKKFLYLFEGIGELLRWFIFWKL